MSDWYSIFPDALLVRLASLLLLLAVVWPVLRFLLVAGCRLISRLRQRCQQSASQ
jgi:hypothetical protein